MYSASNLTPAAAKKSAGKGKSSVSPLSPTGKSADAKGAFRVGDRVEAKFDDADDYYPGVVTAKVCTFGPLSFSAHKYN